MKKNKWLQDYPECWTEDGKLRLSIIDPQNPLAVLTLENGRQIQLTPDTVLECSGEGFEIEFCRDAVGPIQSVRLEEPHYKQEMAPDSPRQHARRQKLFA